MARDDRMIHSSIRLSGKKDGKRFAKGGVITDPDELEKAAKEGAINLQALHDAGAISGTWKGVKPASESPVTPATAK